MSSNPLNLALRFLLELAGMLALGFWGWHQRADGLRWVLALGIPLTMAIIWAGSAVHDDPSRSGKAMFNVPGILRLAVELAFFGLGVWALWDLGYEQLAWLLGVLILLHYLVSYDRVIWLLAQH